MSLRSFFPITSLKWRPRVSFWNGVTHAALLWSHLKPCHFVRHSSPFTDWDDISDVDLMNSVHARCQRCNKLTLSSLLHFSPLLQHWFLLFIAPSPLIVFISCLRFNLIPWNPETSDSYAESKRWKHSVAIRAGRCGWNFISRCNSSYFPVRYISWCNTFCHQK